jgi:hypothetical protein
MVSRLKMRTAARFGTLFAAAAAVMAIMVAVSGCGSSRHVPEACTLIGCNSGISVEVRGLTKTMPRAWEVDVCVAAHCTKNGVRESGKPRGRYVPKPYAYVGGEGRRLHGLGPYPVSVTVRDRHRQILLYVARGVTMERFSPNGVVCGPTCFVRGLKLNVGRRQLELRSRYSRGPVHS